MNNDHVICYDYNSLTQAAVLGIKFIIMPNNNKTITINFVLCTVTAVHVGL